jgi:hypothetical protein
MCINSCISFLFCFLLRDISVRWYCHIYQYACFLFFVFNYYIIIIIIYLLQLGFHPVAVVLTLVHTIQTFSPGGSSPYTSTHNTNGHINIHKNNNTKQNTHNYKTKYIQ